MSIDIVTTLLFLRPGEHWTLNGDTYEGLTWLSGTPKPTKAEIEAAWPDAKAAAEAQREARRSAFRKIAEASGLDESELAAIGLST